jgi:hypothetical protein
MAEPPPAGTGVSPSLQSDHDAVAAATAARAARLINNLEINEQVLYARMINVEQSTLIE